MQKSAYKYRFVGSVNMSEITETLLLAVTAAEALHGRSKVNLDADFDLDENGRFCLIEAGNDVGRDIARIFVGLLTCEIGEEAFTVMRVGVEAAAS